jgi:hypothetical protein
VTTRTGLATLPGKDGDITGRHSSGRVSSGDGRPRRDEPALDRAGFTLADHRSPVPHPLSPAALDGACTGEAVPPVRALTGLD